jgi:hypothetical protein
MKLDEKNQVKLRQTQRLIPLKFTGQPAALAYLMLECCLATNRSYLGVTYS